MLLSILFSPIPGKLVSKIWAGAFIDMKDMLPDNMALLRQLDNFSADKSTSKAKLREIKTLTTWLYCFTAYMAVQTSDPHTRELLTYTHLIIREALRAGCPSLQVREEGGTFKTISRVLSATCMFVREPLHIHCCPTSLLNKCLC